jgi:multiple sugar transport system permease protein
VSRRGALRALALALVALVFSLPPALLVVGSLRQPGLPPPDGFDLVPVPPRFSNYESVFALVPLGRMLLNSVIVVVLAVPLTVLIASLAGFAIAAGRPRLRRLLIGASVLALLVPAGALWVPRFVLFRYSGMQDSLGALVAPALMATSPFYVLLFALTYARLPATLLDAARVEGLGPWRTWWRIAWPLSRPTAFAVALLAFAVHWSNFIDPLLYLTSSERATAPLGLRALATLEPANHGIFLAGAVIVTLPAVIAFLIASRTLFARATEV